MNNFCWDFRRVRFWSVASSDLSAANESAHRERVFRQFSKQFWISATRSWAFRRP